MKNFQEKICPQCGTAKFKTWKELSGEQKFLVERLPLSAEFSLEKRKNHIFCTNCWNEIYEIETENC